MALGLNPTSVLCAILSLKTFLQNAWHKYQNSLLVATTSWIQILPIWLLNRVCCQKTKYWMFFMNFVLFIFSFLVSCFAVDNWKGINHFCEITFLSENRNQKLIKVILKQNNSNFILKTFSNTTVKEYKLLTLKKNVDIIHKKVSIYKINSCC